MNKIDMQNKFFVCYAKAEEKLASNIVDEISKYLEIDYTLWSYAKVDDVDAYFEANIAPVIDNCDFVLFFISGSVVQDEIFKKVYRYCNNLNKSMVPVKVDPYIPKLKEMTFRSRVYDYSEKDDKGNLMEQMHSWLGLTKVYEWSPVKFCSGCGKMIRTNAPFCRWCGKQFLASAEKYCPQCGNHLKSTAAFCNRCGTPLSVR